MTRKVRVHKNERAFLKRLKEIPEVREMAVEDGILNERDERFSYEQLLRLLIPDDADPIERCEEDMVLIGAREMKERVQELAGENVPEHRVVRRFALQFTEEHNLEVEIHE